MIKTFLTTALFASVVITGTVQADNSLSSLIYEESSNIYSEVTHQTNTQEGIVSYSDDANKNSVWSAEFELYDNPSDLKQEVASNLTAAGRMKLLVSITYNKNSFKTIR